MPAAENRIVDWLILKPPSRVASPYESRLSRGSPEHLKELDTHHESFLRDLLLGISHRTLRCFAESRKFFMAALDLRDQTENTWMIPATLYELAVLELKEQDSREDSQDLPSWSQALDSATSWLDQAVNASSATHELSNRLDLRINLLREEIATKRNILRDA